MNASGEKQLKRSTQVAGETDWGAYWNALFPPRLVSPWIDFKRMSTGVNVARRLWSQREYLRHTYKSVHGADPRDWPSQHPGVVLDAVLWVAHAACLRCQLFDATTSDIRTPERRSQALAAALHHESFNPR